MSQPDPQHESEHESDLGPGAEHRSEHEPAQEPDRRPAVPVDHAALTTAAHALAGATDPGWTEATDRVVSAVRGATRRSTPVNAAFVDGRDGDVLQVSDLVVVSALRAALDTAADSAPSSIELTLGGREGHDCLAVQIELVGRYGSDLRALADTARQVALDTLTTLLGSPADGEPRGADVVVTDIADGDLRA